MASCSILFIIPVIASYNYYVCSYIYTAMYMSICNVITITTYNLVSHSQISFIILIVGGEKICAVESPESGDYRTTVACYVHQTFSLPTIPALT